MKYACKGFYESLLGPTTGIHYYEGTRYKRVCKTEILLYQYIVWHA